MKETIGIIGQGFVGSAIREGLREYFNVATYDIDPEKQSSCTSLYQLINKIDDIIFVCLPTPMNSKGRCETKIVEAAIKDINDICLQINKKKIVVIKSTVEPGTTDDFNNKFSKVDILFNPEFLTEANSFDDFKNQTRIIIGGAPAETGKLIRIYKQAFPNTPIMITRPNIAEMVKYFTNCFLATKVMFANEMKQICDSIDVDYKKVTELALYDKRIGRSHLDAPGHDGSYGFGGHCLPKDLNAAKFIALEHNVDPKILNAVWEKNLEVRSEAERDWEKMTGRAVI